MFYLFVSFQKATVIAEKSFPELSPTGTLAFCGGICICDPSFQKQNIDTELFIIVIIHRDCTHI